MAKIPLSYISVCFRLEEDLTPKCTQVRAATQSGGDNLLKAECPVIYADSIYAHS
jgi:hypothetical protein